MAHDLLKRKLERVVNTVSSSGLNDYRVFLQVRNDILTDLIQSLLTESTENLNKVTDRTAIVISLGKQESDETRKIYNELQKGIIFRHFFVESATKRAKHIIACLLCQFLRHPELIPWSFRRKYLGRVDNYRQRLEEIYQITPDSRRVFDISEWHSNRADNEGVQCQRAVEESCNRRIGDLICIKDYVAGMTDRYAEQQFKKCVYCGASKAAWDKLEKIPIL
jgi:dGTP triphosphohydrolase